MSTKGCRTMCAGNQQKTSFCPANGCSKSWSGNPRTVNQMKKLHIKVCPFISSDIERQEYLKNKSLTQNSSGIIRTEYVKPAHNTLLLDPKESTRKDIIDAFLFNKKLEGINIHERFQKLKNGK